MTTLPCPLFSKVYRNADQSVVSDEGFLQYNGYIDELGGLNVRCGERLGIDCSGRTPYGLFHWPERFLVSVEGNQVNFYSVSGTSLSPVTSSSTYLTIPAAQPVIFCTDGTYVFMAAGGKINYINSSGALTEMADADAPTSVSHVAFVDGYLLANNNNNKLYFSDLNASTTWSALNFVTAEGNPDKILAVFVLERQIYLIGTSTVEIWENDGDTPFSRIPGGLIEIGCVAKYSVVRLDSSLIWLSDKRYFVSFSGRNIEPISTPYDKDIAEFATVSDCIGKRIDVGGRTYVLFQFRTENRSIAYDVISKEWTEWGIWNATLMRWDMYDFFDSAYDPISGFCFIAKPTAKVISILDTSSRVDLTSATATVPVKFLRETGHISYGSNKLKRNESLSFRARRGDESSYTSPKLMLRYKTDNKNHWSNIKEIDLGATGNTTHNIKLRRLGIYNTRKYELSATDAVSINLSNAEEEFTILR